MTDRTHMDMLLDNQRRNAARSKRAEALASEIETKLSGDKRIRAALIEAWAMFAAQGPADWSHYLSTVWACQTPTEAHAAIEQARRTLEVVR